MTDETLPMDSDFFGTPSVPGAYGFKYHTISDKEPSVFRIAPPVKSMRATGRWYTYDALHQGYSVPNEQNPDKPRFKPFRCIFKRDRNKMVTQDCPECSRMEDTKRRLEESIKAHAATLKAADPKLSDEESMTQAAVAYKAASASVDKYYVDRKYYVLAKNVAGEWGVLKLPPSLIWGKGQKGQLAVLMDRFSAENNGVSALDPKVGVWFKFKRQGVKWSTTYSVEIETESVGGGAFRYKSAPLTAVDVAGLEKCPDLGTYNDDKALSYDQILRLARSKGNPDEVAAVFGQSIRRTPPPAISMESAPAPTPLPAPMPLPSAVASIPAAAVASVSVAPTPAVQAPVEDELTRLRRQVAEMEARKSAPVQIASVAPTPTVAPPATPKPAAAAPQSFTAMMGLDPQAFLDMIPDAK
jgi:hypothetical protein